LSKRDRAWLDRAVALARLSTANKRHGCIIVKGGRPIGRGYNKYVNKPFFTSQEHMSRCSIHAEIAAIRNVRGSLRGATIYVARINNRGEERYSRPCESCQAVMHKYGIRKAVWTY
jgi:tRNA(Arg) A34 adenosine deaminase TadA